jgi:hypothetical protein
MSEPALRLPRLQGVTLARLVLGFVACAAIAGWAASFVGLHGFALSEMHGYSLLTAWLVPGSFDGAAFACSVLVYRASIFGRSAVRGRVLMYGFTALSGWINWHYQTNILGQWVASALPFAAVLVFDTVLSDLRAEWETRHGQQTFRMRLGLLSLRWLVDRRGTTDAFRASLVAIPVTDLVGLLGNSLPNVAPTPVVRRSEPIVTEPTPPKVSPPPPARPTTPRTPPPAVPRPIPPETDAERTMLLRPIRDEAPAKVQPPQQPAPTKVAQLVRHGDQVTVIPPDRDDAYVQKARADGLTTRREIAAAYSIGTTRAGRIAKLVKESA